MKSIKVHVETVKAYLSSPASKYLLNYDRMILEWLCGFNGETKTVADMARHFNIGKKTMYEKKNRLLKKISNRFPADVFENGSGI